MADPSKACSDRLSAEGIAFAYHHHAVDFERHWPGGQRPIDVLITEAPWLKVELDTYWVHHSSSDVLAVIAILAVLAAILLPVLATAKSSAKTTMCASNLKQIGLAIALYQGDYNDCYPNDGDPYLWFGEHFRWPIMPYLAIGESQAAGGYAASTGAPEVLKCPEDPTAQSTFDATSYAYSASLYHSPAQIATYTIQSLVDASLPQELLCITQSTSSMTTPASKIVADEWLTAHRHPAAPIGFWGTSSNILVPGTDQWTGARNSLFGDGHVKLTWATQQTPSSQNYPDMNLTPKGIGGSDMRSP